MSENKGVARDIHWDLSDLYESPDSSDFKNDKTYVVKMADKFAESYHGKVKELDPSGMKEALDQYESILDIMGKLGSFAYLRWTTNTEDSSFGKLVQEMNELSSEINQKLLFFELEWTHVEEDRAQQLMHHPDLKGYQHHLETARLYKPFRLEEKEEKILSAKSVTGRNAWNRYFDETIGAHRFELDGEILPEQQVLSKMHEPDRELRRRASESMTKGLTEMNRSLTFIFNTLIADKHTNDKLRGYPHWLKSRNLANEIQDESVNSLIDSVTGSYGLVQRYYRLKRTLLGYDELFEYDRYAPLLSSSENIEWPEARKTVLEAYNEFHPRMAEIADQFFKNNWIDAAVKPGKRGGAYSASTVPSVHPYVFMNYDGKVRDVQTLAHELGHGVHQYLSAGQGVLQSGTPLTTAETASVFGEMLVFQKLKRQLSNEREKLALLMGKIDDTIATVYRQISMNRFEHAMHTARREEGELSSDRFSELWMQTQKDLYGDSVTLSDNYRIWWSYIPHFLHAPGYVYAYAFGELLVLSLYQQYQNSENGFSDKYLELLKAGGSDWPENLVSPLGVDINSPDFWENGISAIQSMIEEAELLAKQIQN